MAKKKVLNHLNITASLTTREKKSPYNRKPYDDRKIMPGEVLAPMIATEERIKLLGANRTNIYTWENAGCVYQVMFYPVPKSAKKLAMQQFAFELNELLSNNHDAHCLIPQEDGSTKVCPKKGDDNRHSCVDCPHNEEYVKTIDSFDALLEVGYEPIPSPSAEEEFMFGELFAELMQELHTKYPLEEQVVTMILDGKDKRAIIEKLKLGKSQGYKVISQTIALVENIIRS